MQTVRKASQLQLAKAKIKLKEKSENELLYRIDFILQATVFSPFVKKVVHNFELMIKKRRKIGREKKCVNEMLVTEYGSTTTDQD